jgi:hypothetical protein
MIRLTMSGTICGLLALGVFPEPLPYRLIQSGAEARLGFHLARLIQYAGNRVPPIHRVRELGGRW